MQNEFYKAKKEFVYQLKKSGIFGAMFFIWVGMVMAILAFIFEFGWENIIY